MKPEKTHTTPTQIVEQLLGENGMSPELTKFLQTPNGRQTTIEEIREVEQEYQRFWKPGFSFALGGYAYTPKQTKTGIDFTRWKTSDGGDVKVASLADLVLSYGGDDFFYYDFVQVYPEQSSHIIKKKIKGQEDYELGVMKGDHY